MRRFGRRPPLAQTEKEYMEGPIINIDGETIEDEIDSFSKSVQKAFKSFRAMGMDSCVQIASQIKESVQAFRPNIPVIQGLRNKGIRQRHLDSISEKVGVQLVLDDSFNVQEARAWAFWRRQN